MSLIRRLWTGTQAQGSAARIGLHNKTLILKNHHQCHWSSRLTSSTRLAQLRLLRDKINSKSYYDQSSALNLVQCFLSAVQQNWDSLSHLRGTLLTSTKNPTFTNKAASKSTYRHPKIGILRLLRKFFTIHLPVRHLMNNLSWWTHFFTLDIKLTSRKS